ncbi:MAG: arylformamidase [Erythrobacter sp.]|jgi:arylformamidase|uniref:arylformamidase n=1 Tax=Qipengyuania citrea TaxID=225971 RepID=UPI000BD014FC|nr:arylformamidase [Qipengyuania citrea]MCP2017887.1 arylformamidase [Qipengyuania citrea]MDE0902917.1 arylformamidase [Erythrobacter sp.]PCH77729.1 MAG: arylformamidase [Erythrobacteraceae bacterium]
MSSWKTTRRIWDISQTLRPGLPVWPGDTAFAFDRTWKMEDGSPVNVGRMTMSTHSGTHGDAPLHYSPAAPDIASVALDPYLGECLVVDATDVSGGRISVGDLPHIDSADRVLFRTFERFPHDDWDSSFTAIDAEAIEWLALQGVKLVGTDAPSVDPQDSKTMDAHKAVLAHEMRILEGLVLDDVPEGRYELIALPLKIAGGDAGLTRAILRELPHD